MLKMAKNKYTIGIIIAVSIILIVLMAQGVIKLPIGGKTLAAAPTGNYVQVPTFMWYKCDAASIPIDSPTTDIVDGDAHWLSCPKNTDSCDLYIQQTEKLGLFSWERRIVYQICDSSLTNCQAQVIKPAGGLTEKGGYPTVVINGLTKNDRVYVNYQYLQLYTWKNVNGIGARYYYRYKPFILWKYSFLSGAKEYTSVQQGCVFPSGDRGNLLDYVSNLLNVQINKDTSTSDYELEPYKTRSFIEAFISMSVENFNFVTFSGKSGYCLNRQVYSIGEVTTNTGTYKIVNTNYNSILGAVNCCPGETEPTRKCGDDFNWHEITQVQCSAFKPCAGADWYPSGKSKELIIYNCISGQCVPQTKQVECTTNNDCIGNPKGNLCDTKLWQCVNVPVPPPINVEICNNGIDDDKDGLIDSNDPDCKVVIPTCKSCDEFALSKIALKQCKPAFLQNMLTCSFSFIKLAGVALVFLFGLLFGKGLFSSFEAIRDKEWLAWLLSIIVAGILAYLVFALFWLGVIIFIIFIIAQVVIKLFLPTKYLKAFRR